MNGYVWGRAISTVKTFISLTLHSPWSRRVWFGSLFLGWYLWGDWVLLTASSHDGCKTQFTNLFTYPTYSAVSFIVQNRFTASLCFNCIFISLNNESLQVFAYSHVSTVICNIMNLMIFYYL